jgi:UDP-N-acetylglucosamine diphosphorylase/glucosamine-1-phosphate N-acetyltransferase
MTIGILILAGGLGKRMSSDVPKVLHKINNKSLLEHVIETAIKLNPDKIGIILGKYRDIIQENLKKNLKTELLNKIEYIYQKEALGTWHAVICGIEFIKKYEKILILSGDVPLITVETLTKLINLTDNCAILVNSIENPYGYGRIKYLESNKIKIVEEKDATHEEKEIKEINSGIYCFESNNLIKNLPKLNCNNSQNEYYLTDLISLYDNINVLKSENNNEILGVNDIKQLEQLEKLFLDY